MIKNIGFADKLIRLGLAAVFVALGVFHWSTGWWWLALVGLVPLITGLLGYCPIWHLFKIKTISIQKRNQQ